MVPPYSCLLSYILLNAKEKIKSLPYEEFLAVLEHVKKLVLPEEFVKDLELEYKIRGSNHKQKY
jgi:hypothetical protein